ncbi:MAG: aldolase/citrate lyase family protein [Chloroflexota bacterium]
MNANFALFLFSTNPIFIRQAVAAGVKGIIVDWEYIGKETRQAFADTQITRDTLDDLRRVRACTEALVICRINSYGATTVEEVDQAIGAGADEVLLPMVRAVEEVERVLDQARGRCGVGILVETVAAAKIAKELACLPVSRIYVGLNDLAIERKTPNIFTAVADGTVERIRRAFHVPFGFGGLTLPDRGYPIPCRLLIGEMARLPCDFSFLRRSFHRDIQGRDLAVEIPRLLEALRRACLRSPEAIARDQSDLAQAIAAWSSEIVKGFSPSEQPS